MKSLFRKYASDPDDCLPKPAPENHPITPTPNFDFPVATFWDEFLHRYYEPVADAGEDQIVFVGQVYTLDGSGSSDADEKVFAWFWDVDETVNADPNDEDKDCVDEKTDDGDLQGKILNVASHAPGKVIVTLTVRDDHENLDAGHPEADQDSAVITVLPLGACDVDLDGDIDIDDIFAILRTRGEQALPGDPRDPDVDGMVTLWDAKLCMQVCDNPRCAR
jgi:hypothetical protein